MPTPKDLEFDTIDERPGPQEISGHMAYKVVNVPHHQKSHSYGQASTPGIYNMYMGQVKQLKKQRITMNKIGGLNSNNTQPTHFINLNAEASNMITSSHASLESLKNNSSVLQKSHKIKMSVTHKAP